MTDIPDDLGYSRDHLWVRPGAAGVVRCGVTDFAQDSLGDVVSVTVVKPGTTVRAGEACGDIESTKSVNDLIAPAAGKVVARNDELAGAPELVNSDPYGDGWLFELSAEPADLLDAAAYRRLVGA